MLRTVSTYRHDGSLGLTVTRVMKTNCRDVHCPSGTSMMDTLFKQRLALRGIFMALNWSDQHGKLVLIIFLGKHQHGKAEVAIGKQVVSPVLKQFEQSGPQVTMKDCSRKTMPPSGIIEIPVGTNVAVSHRQGRSIDCS